MYGSGDEDESWDAVLTCFFIDTAKNILDYLRILHDILKPGGVWINCGPLLWHFENVGRESSIELSMEEVKALCSEIGFEIKVGIVVPMLEDKFKSKADTQLNVFFS